MHDYRLLQFYLREVGVLVNKQRFRRMDQSRKMSLSSKPINESGLADLIFRDNNKATFAQ
jgi:hypothetical protein